MKILNCTIIFILLLFSLFPNKLYSDQKIFILENSEIEYLFDNNIEYSIVKKEINVEDPRKLYYQRLSSNFGYTEHQIWTRLKLKNNTDNSK